MKKTSALILVSAIGLAMVGCKGGDSTPDTVATVNGSPISTKDFYDYLIRKSSVEVQTGNGQVARAPVASPLGLQALHDLVNNKLILQLAKQAGVAPSEQDIKDEIALRGRINPDYLPTLLHQPGITLAMVERDTELQLAQSRLLTKGITIPAADVDAYMKDNAAEFQTPADYKMLYVQVSSPGKQAQVDKDLSQGQSFQTVALRYSEGPNVAKTKAVVAEHNPAKFPPDLKTAVEKTSVGQTTPWIHLGPNFYKFFVEDKTEAKPPKDVADIKILVQRQLAEQKGRTAINLQDELTGALKQGQIDVSFPSLKDGWNAAMEQLKATSAAGARGGPGAGASTPATTPAKK